MSAVRIQYTMDAAGTLELYPREGQADADGDVYVYTQGTSLLDSTLLNGSSNAIVDTVSTAISANASAGDDTVTVTSATGLVVGRRYTIVNHEGRKQEITLLGLSSTTARLDQPLDFACTATTSTFTGHRLACALTTTHTSAVRRRMRVLWVYDVDSVTYRTTQWIDVVRIPFDLDVTEEDLEELDPGFGEWTGSRDGWKKARKGGLAAIWSYLAAQGIYPDLVRDLTLLRLAAAQKTLELFYFRMPALSERWGEAYRETMAAFQTSRAWYDSDHDMVLDGLVSAEDGEGEDLGDISERVYSPDEPAGETMGGTSELGLPTSYLRVG